MYRFHSAVASLANRGLMTCVRDGFKPISASRHELEGRVFKAQTLFSTKNLFSSQSCERASYYDLASSPLIKEDLKNLHNDAKAILRANIKNDELYDITAHHFRNCAFETRPWNMAVLIAKALRFHIFGEESLTEVQRKVLAITDIIFSSVQLTDDIVDNDRMRESFNSAFVHWGSKKVSFAGRASIAISLSEAAKLGSDVTKTLGHMMETTYRGQYLGYESTVPDGDFFRQYLTFAECRSGSPYQSAAAAISQCSGASYLLTDAMARFGFNYGVYTAFQDETHDFEKDIKVGYIMSPVIFASEEHSVLERMMLRRFTEDGDVEKAIELVRNSRGIEKTKVLGGSYITESRRCLETLAPSPYRTELEKMLRYDMECVLGLEAKEKKYVLPDERKKSEMQI